MNIKALRIKLDKLAGEMSVQATLLNEHLKNCPSERLNSVVNRLRAGNILLALDQLDEYLGE